MGKEYWLLILENNNKTDASNMSQSSVNPFKYNCVKLNLSGRRPIERK
jgi:hypothetical protein